ncbi:MAG TPA: helix-turn-helix transcriptional regulator [Candidatus Polarisedimenticolia bacterium]|nr:helix-turn-helix transcriptional regulator [Candidatus Polarisedimenticolia bacterium]
MPEEREQAEAMLEGDGSDWPPVADRVRQARERVGLSVAEVMDRLGMSGTEYQDVEWHDDEVFTSLSVKEIAALAGILKMTVSEMLFGSRATGLAPPVSYAEIARRLEELARSEKTTLDELGNRIGWDLDPIVRNPEALGDLNIPGLHDICKPLGLDWLSILELPGGKTG